MVNNANFNSKDRDNDASPGNCANIYIGPWWALNCLNCKLTGIYGPGQGGDGIVWLPYFSLKYADMKIIIV
jgi:ficolin